MSSVDASFSCSASEPGVFLITRHVLSSIKSQTKNSQVKNGAIVHICLDGKNAAYGALSINENADPTVRTDMEGALDHLVPSEAVHDKRTRARVQTMLMDRQLTLTLSPNARNFVLGTWQGIYLFHQGSGAATFDIVCTIYHLDEPPLKAYRASLARRDAHDISQQVQTHVGQSHAKGVYTMMMKHTSAALTLCQRNSGPAMNAALDKVVPEAWNDDFFEHTYEGPDDMPGHVKSSLCGVTCSIPVNNEGMLATSDAKLCDSSLFAVEARNVGGWGNGHNRTIDITFRTAVNQFKVTLPKDKDVIPLSIANLELKKAAQNVAAGTCHLFLLTAQAALQFIPVLPSSQNILANAQDVLRRANVDAKDVATLLPMIMSTEVTLPIRNGVIMGLQDSPFKDGTVISLMMASSVEQAVLHISIIS